MHRHTAIKVLLTATQKESVKRWLRRMRREDPNFADAPKARFGSNYVRLEILTALALMPWTDTSTSGDLDAYRFKRDTLRALQALEASEHPGWWRTGLTRAIEIIKDTPVGEFTADRAASCL